MTMLQAQQTVTPVAPVALAQRLLILAVLTTLTILTTLALLTSLTCASDTYRAAITGQEKPVLEFLRTFETLSGTTTPRKIRPTPIRSHKNRRQSIYPNSSRTTQADASAGTERFRPDVA